MNALARRTDPITSHLAGQDAKRHAPRGQQVALQALIEAGCEGHTDFSLAEATGWQQTSVGKRRLELERKGYVTATLFTRRTPSGSLARVYCVTDAGIEAGRS